MSLLGAWSPWYERLTPADAAARYGGTVTYAMAADWLSGLSVEDWGCGFGTFRRHHDAGYWGVDGTPGFCDLVADLEQRRSPTPGLLLRHVLEHNTGWRDILGNAAWSARRRIVVIVFTPDGHGEQVGWTDELCVPDLALPHADITAALTAWAGPSGVVTMETVSTPTAYGAETVWLAAR